MFCRNTTRNDTTMVVSHRPCRRAGDDGNEWRSVWASSSLFGLRRRGSDNGGALHYDAASSTISREHAQVEAALGDSCPTAPHPSPLGHPLRGRHLAAQVRGPVSDGPTTQRLLVSLARRPPAAAAARGRATCMQALHYYMYYCSRSS